MGGVKSLKATIRRGREDGGRLGKIVAPLDEKLQSVKWGEFSYQDFFTLLPIKIKLTKEDFDFKGNIPVYSSESLNNGISGYTVRKADYILNNKDIHIIFGDHTRTFNIATSDFCVMDNVKVLVPINLLSKSQILFIISSWQKCIPNKGYARHWSIAKDVKFNLPTQDGAIDFEFMDSFIAELEAQRIAELEAYLTVTGLKDYTLTEAEKKALGDFNSLKFEEFNVVDVFNVKNSGNILSRDISENSGKTPYLCASAENNAVSSYISYNENYLDKGNCIFIGGKTFVVTYQEKDFYSNDSHNLILHLKNECERSQKNQLYLATCINKSLGHKYSWGNSISKSKIQTDRVSLPVVNKQPNYAVMETFISAIQKIVIKDVVLYADKKIAATKTVVDK